MTTSSDSLLPIKPLENVAAYQIPQSKHNIRLKLDANEGYCAPEEIARCLESYNPALTNIYPLKTRLEALIAERFSVKPEQVIVTNGGDDAIDRACRAVLTQGKKLLLATPTFEMFEKYAAITGATIDKVRWEGEFPENDFIEAITPETKCIALVSPNNPTGKVISFDIIKRISEAAPQALLIVDNAYAEFAEKDISRQALELPNAIVIRTFSKAWGLAGLRVGYALGSEKLITWLRTTGGPYPVSQLSLHVACTRYQQGPAAICDYLDEVKSERADLFNFLLELGAKPTPSEANFVYAEVAGAEQIKKRLEELGILIRYFSGNPELQNGFRITLPGRKAEYTFLKNALAQAFADIKENIK